MRSRVNERFRKAFDSLPEAVQRKARDAYARWRENPAHPSLSFKKIHHTLPVYSVRIELGWRAVGIRDDDDMIWFWIGSHAEYDKLIAQLRKRG